MGIPYTIVLDKIALNSGIAHLRNRDTTLHVSALFCSPNTLIINLIHQICCLFILKWNLLLAICLKSNFVKKKRKTWWLTKYLENHWNNLHNILYIFPT